MRVATRILTLTTETGPVAVPVHLDAPESDEDGGWSCAYEIGWPDGPRRHAGWGADAVQALHITLQLIGAALYRSDTHAEGRLSWDASPAGGYGFPMPTAMRDALVGDDARFL